MLRKTAHILFILTFVFVFTTASSHAADLDFLVIDTGVTSATFPLDAVIKQKLSVTNTSDQSHEINFSAYFQETEDELSSWPYPQVLRFAPGQTLYVQIFMRQTSDLAVAGDYQRTVEWRFEDQESGESRTEIVTHRIEVLDPQTITGDLQVSGTVVDRYGATLSGVEVTLSTGNWELQTQADDDGTFSFPGVPMRDDWFIRAQGVAGTGFVYVDPAVESYVIELTPAKYTATFSITESVSSPIGGYWSGAIDASARSILLVSGVGAILDDRDTSAATLELYTLDGVLQWAYGMGHGGWGADLSRDGTYAAFTTAYPMQTFGVLDGATGEPLWVHQADAYGFGTIDSREIALSNTNAYVAIGDGSSEVVLADLLTGELIWHTDVFTPVRRILFSDDDTYVYVATDAGQAYKLKTSDGSVVWSATVGQSPNGFVLSADGRYVGTASSTGEVTLLDAEAGLPIWQADVQGGASWLDFSPDGEYVFVGGGGQYANTLYDTQNGRPVWTLADSSHHGQFAAEGEYLLISGKESLFFVDMYGNTIGSLAIDYASHFAYLLGDGTHLVAVGGQGGNVALFAVGTVVPVSDTTDENGGDTSANDTSILFILLGVMGVIVFAGIVVFATKRSSTSPPPAAVTKPKVKKAASPKINSSSKWLEKKRTTATVQKPTRTTRKSATTKANEPEESS